MGLIETPRATLTPAGADYFTGLNAEIADKGFLVAASDDLINWARTGSLMWMTFGPWFVLTGHTLMVGDLGRTELAVSAEEGARKLFGSVRRLKALPDHVEILPGAYAGSVCGRRRGKPWSAIGFEKCHNQAFGIEDEAAFIRFMVAEIPPAPPEAARIGAANSGLIAAAA